MSPTLRTFLLSFAAAAVLSGAAVGAVAAYDHGRRDTIPSGVQIGGIDVGGQSVTQARATLQREVLDPMGRAVRVRTATRTFRLSAREARATVDLDASVRRALAIGRSPGLFARAWRDARGQEVKTRVPLDVQYSAAAVSRLVDRVRAATDRRPRDASVGFAPAGLRVKKARTGRQVVETRLRARVRAALENPARSRFVRAPIRTTKPRVTNAEVRKKYPTIITVDRGTFTLRLFRGLKVAKTYRVAVGAEGLDTPAGLYGIQNMETNPTWHVPDSDWAGDLAGQVIPPGPGNPIKARWMGIFNGAGIHGTSDDGSIGSRASHGCIRMHVWDVEDLYDRVKVGTPVYIV